MVTYKTLKGQFRPRNPTKYKGNVTNIIYRSGWELKVMFWLDKHPEIVQWSSEELIIPYKDPVSGGTRRYFPDFWVKFKNDEIYVFEVKPFKETVRPTTKNKRRLLREQMTYGRNLAKWMAAEKYCTHKGWKFKKLTERELFGQNV